MHTNRIRSLVALVLALGLCACDAPEVIPRQPPATDDGAATAGPAHTASADLLAQIDAMKAKLAGLKKPVGVLLALGNLYYQNERFPDAIDSYRQAVDGAKPALDARKALVAAKVKPAKSAPSGCDTDGPPGAFAKAAATAAALASSGRKAEALACYDEVLDPISTALARRGAAWSMLDRPAAAVDDLDRSLALRPDQPEALYLMGAVIFQSLGQNPDPVLVKKGQHAWQRFIAVDPTNPRVPDVKKALVQVAQMLAKPKAGAAQGAAAQGATPQANAAPPAPPAGSAGPMMGGGGGKGDMLPPVLQMAEQQLESGNAQAALQITNQFLAVATGYPGALVMKARVLMALGRGAEAGPLLDQAMQRDQSGRTFAAMAEYQAKVKKDVAAAKADYAKAIAKDPAYAKQAGLAQKLAALK